MNNNLRDSGIETVGKIRWGTHICFLYSSKEEYFQIVAPYIKSGLTNNELCIWVYFQNISCDEIKGILGNYIENIDVYIKNGQLLIIPYMEWYLENNTFKEIRVNALWNKYIKMSLAKGYDGLRAVADTSGMVKNYSRSFSDYEYNVNDLIYEKPFLAMCLYDTNILDAFEMADAIKNHSYAIVKHNNNYELIKNIELLIKDKQLEESERKYENLLKLLPVSVFIHDENQIYYCNEAALSITGLNDIDELYKKSMIEFISPDSKYSFRQYINGIINGDKNNNYFQCEFCGLNGETKNVEIVSTKHNYLGYNKLLSVIRDMTPFRKVTELQKSIEEKEEQVNSMMKYDRKKTEFLVNLSHELRTPLNVILGAIQLMEFDLDLANNCIKEPECLKVMKHNCFRLVRLINNLIDMTKIDLNYFHINKRNCDIVNLVEKITLSVVDYAKSKNITVTFDTNTEEKIIACDPEQIERIVLNLLSNAIKFTQQGGNIFVRTCDCGDKIRIIVKDNGIGIPKDKQKSIFNKFEQVDKSLTREHEGSGIGLSIVKALVEKHNGSIKLNSELGKGSEFIVELPCEVLDESKYKSGSSSNDKISDIDEYNDRIYLELTDIN